VFAGQRAGDLVEGVVGPVEQAGAAAKGRGCDAGVLEQAGQVVDPPFGVAAQDWRRQWAGSPAALESDGSRRALTR
jgi:hypothetical protein